MTYFPDLTSYTYFNHVGDYLNIGWLDKSEPYAMGETTTEFKEKLLEFCFDEFSVLLTRGFHGCNLENCSGQFVAEQRGDKIAHCGSAEIRVIAQSAIYAAPDMIYHYVTVHNYRPPDEFIEAVLSGPSPSSIEHLELREKIERYYTRA